MGNRLITAGGYLLAGVIATAVLAAVATGMEEAPLPVTAASQEAESACTAADGAMVQAPGRRAP